MERLMRFQTDDDSSPLWQAVWCVNILMWRHTARQAVVARHRFLESCLLPFPSLVVKTSKISGLPSILPAWAPVNCHIFGGCLPRSFVWCPFGVIGFVCINASMLNCQLYFEIASGILQHRDCCTWHNSDGDATNRDANNRRDVNTASFCPGGTADGGNTSKGGDGNSKSA